MLQGSIKAAPPVPAAPPASPLTRGGKAALRARHAEEGFRAEALWKTAPWLAGLSIACALIVFWALRDHTPLVPLMLWTGLVVAATWVVLRARHRATEVGTGPIARSGYWAVIEAAVLSGLWGSLVLFAMRGQPVAVQLVVSGALGTMMAGAFLLAMVPIAATVWAGMIAAALLYAANLAGAEPLPLLVLMLGGYLGVILTGCLTVEAVLARQIEQVAEERASREAIGQLLREYEEQGVGWLWQIDTNNLLTYVSPRICGLLGRSTSQLLGQSLPVALGCDSRLGGALVAREPFNAIEVEVAAAGGTRVVSMTGNPVIGADGSFHGFRGVGVDVTEVRRSQERLTHMASVDVLTGLPNRQRMRELFAHAIEAAERDNVPCAILFLDLDGFKPVNDSFGHPIGDVVLRTVAQRLASVIGGRGHVGRIGGDEFAMVVHDGKSRKVVEDLALSAIQAISEPMIVEGLDIRVGLSIGAAFAPIDGTNVDDLVLKADLALYQAKSQGRGAYCHFDARMQRDAEDRLKLEQDLRNALKRNELLLYYQPIVSASDQSIVGFEALLRWQHPQRGLVPPNVFIPIAEETGLIADIGEWVIMRACEDAASWPDRISVSVNISPRQLVVPALPNAVSEALLRSRLQPDRLELEVTESVFMSDSDGSLDVLRRVRGLGCGIALDDFGTGYSSLGYLNKTIFHTLKIDGSFVRESAHRSETVAIIRAIVALANSFRMKITAEGVETPEDFARMQELGCHKIQGYLFGKPMPVRDTYALVGTRAQRRVG
jgi:diguanylate cyclase (GGDEF)-like protein/PAS domain S-box-containing protein